MPYSTPAPLRAPIHNPYDKFTAQQFDEWIGDLTGQLKRALGREEPPSPEVPQLAADAQEPEAPGDLSFYSDEAADDSFAEVKARRAAKGKERAVHYEEDDQQYSEEDYGSEEDEDEEDEEEDISSRAAALQKWNDANGFDDDDDYSSSEQGSDDVKHSGTSPDDVIEILSSDDEEEATAPIRIGPPHPSQSEAHQVDEEDDLYEDDYDQDDLRSSPAGPGIADHDAGYRLQSDEEEEEYEEDEAEIEGEEGK